MDSKKINSIEINLQLGDIIQIYSPDNINYHEKIYYIKFINNQKIILLNSEKVITLSISETGNFLDETIQNIILIHRQESPSFIIQNKLEINNFISIYIGEPLPYVINAIITNIEEDMIELSVNTTNEIIYIDFAYSGIPENLNIEKIIVKEKIKSIPNEPTELDITDDVQNSLTIIHDINNEDDYDLINHKEDEKLQEILLDSVEIEEEFEEFYHSVNVPESEKRYTLDIQLNDYLDVMLSKYNTTEINDTILDKINLEMIRYKELREIYSDIDENNNLILPKSKNKFYKPLKETLTKFDKKLHWIIPIISSIKEMISDKDEIPDEYDNDIDNIKLGEFIEKTNNAINLWVKNTSKEIAYDYKKYINTLLTIYDNDRVREDILYNITNISNNKFLIKTQLEAINNILGDFYSYSILNNELKSTRFIRNVYNPGLTMIESEYINYKKNYKLVELTHDDKISITSFLTLPIQFFKLSKINGNYSNIYEKSNLDNIKYLNDEILNNETIVNTNILDESNMYNFINTNENINNELFENINNYSINDNIELDYQEKYNLLLESFIPTKINIIKSLTNNTTYLNLNTIIKDLESANIDNYNLHSKDLKYIKKIIKKNILNYKKDNKIFKKLLNKIILILNNDIYKETKTNNPLIFNLLKKELIDDIIEIYDIDTNTFMNTSEILNYFISIDNAKFFISAVNKNIMDLLVGNLLENFIKQNEKDEKDKKDEKIELDKSIENCEKYYLSKKYSNIEELEADNNKTIFFDAIYDNTVYSLINEYTTEKESMDSSQFFQFLTNKLMDILNMTKKNALREANAIINEKREIINDDYALLLDKRDHKNYIYIRKDSVWVLDDKFKSDFYIDSNKILCDINKDCITKDDKCISNTLFLKNNNKEDIDKILSNFHAKYNLSIQELQGKISEKYEFSKSYIEKIKHINYKNSLVNNDLLLKYYKEPDETIVISPYEEILDKILGLPDIIKRYEFIKKFCLKYTREALNLENVNWLYCNKTGIKLIPLFLLKLANAFIEKDNYRIQLDTICAEQGTISDDNNYWVDKHSGFIIKAIEFDTEEGFDEKGYKLKTNELIQEDYQYTINQDSKKLNPDIKIITSIIKAITQMAGIKLENQHDFIIKNVITIHKKTVPNEETYKKQLKLKSTKKDGKIKNLPSYEDTYNNYLLLLTLAFITLAIQINIPNIKSKKTFPGCIKSFTGYPFEGDQDKSSLIYIACIANKIKTNIKPWNSILGTSESTIVKKLETLIEKYIIDNKEIQELINKKKQYLLYNKEEIIPEDLSIEKWSNYIPPLKDIKISSDNSQPLSDTFYDELIDIYSKGKKNNLMDTLISKQIYLSNSIIESIQNIVKKHVPLLENNTGEPFLENACCNTNINTIDFFSKQDKSIISNNSLVNYYNTIKKKINKISSPSILYDNRNTKIILPKIKQDFNDNIIYKSFIHYCNFDNDVPINEDLKSICMEKPANFVSESIESDIEFLKSQGKNYNRDNLDSLLSNVSKNNILINKEYTESINNIELLKEIIENYQNYEDENNIDKLLFEKLSILLDTYDLTKSENKKELDDLKNHLLRINIVMKNNIIEFIKKQSNISIADKKSLEKLMDFKINNNNKNFFKNYINNLLNVFPNIILNKNINYTSIPKHWNLSETHNKDIIQFIEKYYTRLMIFSNIPGLDKAFAIIKNKMNILIKLINYTYYNYPIVVSINNVKKTIYSIFDTEYIENLYTYIIYSIINEYVNITENSEFKLQIQSTDDYDIEEFNSKISTFILDFLNILSNHLNLINNGYKKIKEKIIYAKEKEKDLITDYLKHLTDDEREIENVFKINKLEKWSKGLQKGLTQYVAENYDEERNELEKQILKEKQLNKIDNVSEMNKELYKFDIEQEEQIQDDIENEEYNMNNIPDDDDYNSEQDDY